MVVTGTASTRQSSFRGQSPRLLLLFSWPRKQDCSDGLWPLPGPPSMLTARLQTPGYLPDTGTPGWSQEEGRPLPGHPAPPAPRGLLMLPLAFSCEDSSLVGSWVVMV